MLLENVADLIGNTPIIKIKEEANIFAKCEFLNPSGSVKDRIALAMLDGAKLNSKSVVVEPTSGNTGIALASVCAAKNIRLILTMPESMSIERRKLLLAMGAELRLSKASLGMQGAVDLAQEIAQKTPNSVILSQFENPNNPKAHAQTTAQEIITDLGKDIDVFVAGVGTGGTLSGVGEILKQHNPNIKIIAVEPCNSAVLNGGKSSSHKIQGIGAGFIPKTFNAQICDEIICVSDEDAIAQMKKLIANEGLLVGISSGANVFAAKALTKRFKDKKILTILCDSYMRYLSMDL